MRRKNGYMTFCILALGTAALLLAASAAHLSAQYVRSARQYEEALQLSYASESALLVSWRDLRSRRWQDMPERRTWAFNDVWGIAEGGQRIEIQCVASPYSLPFNGVLRASAVSDHTLLKRTCALQFRVQKGDDGSASFAVRQIVY